MKGKHEPLEQYFWSHVEKTDSCWVWNGPRNIGARPGRIGYGIATIHQHKQAAHRISWEMHFGPIPPGMIVCHHCDNPPCIRPDHLFLGTPKDNTADMIAKGRERHTPLRGSANPLSKLTEEAVIEIRRRYEAGGITHLAIAQEYNVTETAIQHVIKRWSWKHIP